MCIRYRPTVARSYFHSDKSDVIYHETAILDGTSAGVATFDETTHDGDLGATNGGSTVTLDQIDITNVFDADASGETEDVTEADFEDSDSSTANQITTVELQLQTEVNGAQSANPTNDVSAKFDVEVENLDETSTTGGDGGTTAE